MNTDRELLELAAKAAGIEGEWVENSLLDDYYKLPTTGILMWSEGRRHIWNPITSSGDALRLAIKLNMGISIPVMAAKYARVDVITFRSSGVNVIEACKDDPYAATRRAIVRAAAEIGRNM